MAANHKAINRAVYNSSGSLVIESVIHIYSIHLLILSDVTARSTTKIYGHALSRISHSVGDFK